MFNTQPTGTVISRRFKKKKSSAPIISWSVKWIWMLLRLVGWFDEPTTHFILSSQYSRERTLLLWFCNLNVYRMLSFEQGMMKEATELYILVSVWMTLTFIQDHSLWEMKNFCTYFFHIYLRQFECYFVTGTVGLLKHMLNLFYTINIQERKLNFCEICL